MKYNFPAIKADFISEINFIISLLPSRQQDVLRSNYGLFGEEKRSLADIGREYGISRERVRQIHNAAINNLKRNYKLGKLEEMIFSFVKYIQSNGGVIAYKQGLNWFFKKFEWMNEHLNELMFLFALTDEIVCEPCRKNFGKMIRLNSLNLESLYKLNMTVFQYMKKLGENVMIPDLCDVMSLNVSQKLIKMSFSLDKRFILKKDEVSLGEWRHINPQTLYDKIKYVLNERNEPMHYSEIAECIRNIDAQSKNANTLAVRNELVGSKEFVVIGQGVYAMSEWGYKPGTVKDVITALLEEFGPMKLSDLTERVLEHRVIKPDTVRVTLTMAKNMFIRTEDDEIILAA